MNSKTSLGIEISQNSLSFALLSKTKSTMKIVKAGRSMLPAGCIVDGNIADPAKLAKALRHLLRSNRIVLRQAHISLVANPHLLQIIDLPLEMPGNIAAYIESEIKHSAILLGRAHKSDYCGLSGKSLEGGKRVIVSAVEEKKLSLLIKTLGFAKIEPLSIEPSSISWIRALYDKYVSTNFNYNVLFAILTGSTVTMCVFRKGVLDYIRSRQLPIGAGKDEYSEVFSTQIRNIKQYYDVEVSSFKDEQWIAVMDVNSEYVQMDKFSDYLNGQFEAVYVCSDENSIEHTALPTGKAVKQASVCAVGLAMKQVARSTMGVKFDLVPSVEREKKAVRRWFFAAACFAIAIISAMALIHNMISVRLIQANSIISSVRSEIKVDQIAGLLRQQKHLDANLDGIRVTNDYLNEALTDSKMHDWPAIFGLLATNSPKDLCIMDLRQIGDNTLIIHGKVMTHSSAHKFTAKLDDSDILDSAVVSQLSNDRSYQGLVDYTIDCVMKAKDYEDKKL